LLWAELQSSPFPYGGCPPCKVSENTVLSRAFKASAASGFAHIAPIFFGQPPSLAQAERTERQIWAGESEDKMIQFILFFFSIPFLSPSAM